MLKLGQVDASFLHTGGCYRHQALIALQSEDSFRVFTSFDLVELVQVSQLETTYLILEPSEKPNDKQISVSDTKETEKTFKFWIWLDVPKEKAN